ncbi:MAG TPA: AsmA-like C-terminal domain-containing protein [Rhizomicrobium sp.]|nr:AsmA-like C-terminal domain-containing protein [Rhizomicrobium sp.]
MLRAYRGPLQLAALVVGGIATAVVFFVLGAVIRVLIGPVSLGPFNGQVAEAISNSLPGLAVGYDQAAIEWSPDEHRINLVILGARVLDQQQRIIAQAPKAEIDLAAGPFLHGNLQVKRIALVGVQLTLVRTKAGTLRLGLGRDAGDNDVLDRIREAISKSKSGGDSLETFAVRHARLAFYDEGSGAFVVSPDANFQLSTGEGAQAKTTPGLEAGIEAALEISGEPSHLVASLRLPRGKGAVSGNVTLTGLDLSVLARNAKALAFFAPFVLNTDVSGSFVFDHGTHLHYADLGIDASGIVKGGSVPLHVRALKVVARYDGDTGKLLVDDASLEGDHARAHITGHGKLDFDSDNVLTLATLDLSADQLAVNMPGIVKQSIALGHFSAHAIYTPAIERIDIQNIKLSGGPMNAQLNAAITLAGNRSPAIAADGTIGAMPLRAFLNYWPLHVAEGAREWIDENITAGRIGPIALHADIKTGALDLPGLPDDALNLSVPLADATVTYIHGFPPMTGVQGTALLTGDTFKATIAQGTVGPLKMTQGVVTIAQLHAPGTIADIHGHIDGSVGDLLKLIDNKPLQYPTRFHINPASAKGMASTDLSVQVPTRHDVNTDQIGISAQVATTDFGVQLGKSTKITGGDILFNVTNKMLHATGTAAMSGAPLNIDWTEDFDTKSDITTTILAKGMLDDATRAALNINVNDLITGPVNMTAKILGHRGDLRSAAMTVDLTPATMSMDILNFHKAPGTPATAQVNAVFGNGSSMKTAAITASGAGLNLHGTVFFTNGDMTRLEFPDVRVGANNDFALIYSETPAGGLDVSVHGKSADGTGIGRTNATTNKAPQPSTAASSEPFHFSVRLDRIAMRDNVNFSNFTLDVAGVGNKPQTMSLTAMLPKSGKLAGTIAPSDAGRIVTVTSNDTGDLLNGLFGFDSMVGGDLLIKATLSPVNLVKAKAPLDYSGVITVRDFKIVNQPFLARLFAAGSLIGIGDLLSGSGITIDKMEVPFRAQNDFITIHDARAAGPAVGFTADGYVDRAGNQIALKGTLAPAYGLNSILGNIPLLGDVLVSKKGEGVFGMTYSATGNADQPNISVNPLSALAPGIFRRIFEGSTPVAPTPAPNLTPQANVAPAPATPQQ